MITWLYTPIYKSIKQHLYDSIIRLLWYGYDLFVCLFLCLSVMASFMVVNRVLYKSGDAAAPLCYLYFCRYCLKLRSAGCVSHEVAEWWMKRF